MKPSLVIVGLGNPGASYERTRHNVGFQAMDALVSVFGTGEWEDRQKFLSSVCEGRVQTVPVLFVKPHTFMNRSGEAVRKIVDFYKLRSEDQLLILSDDVDLPLGDVRLRRSGGPGTHNGLKSIVETLGENFPRIRVGVGSNPSGEDLAAWILSLPLAEERAALQRAYGTLAPLLREYIFSTNLEERGRAEGGSQ